MKRSQNSCQKLANAEAARSQNGNRTRPGRTAKRAADRKAKNGRAPHGPRKSLIGLRFGRLMVLSLCDERSAHGTCLWRCECDCGNETNVITNRLTGGFTQSCGCLQKERTSQANFKHGKGETREYFIWCQMKSRCQNSSNKSFHNYGGRGIRVCVRWENSISNFLSDMGECPKGLTIERINNDGNYEPGNCRWATQTEQQRNKRTNRNLLFRGELLCVAVWARRLDRYPSELLRRLNNGWSVEETLATPFRKLRRQVPAKSTVAI